MLNRAILHTVIGCFICGLGIIIHNIYVWLPGLIIALFMWLGIFIIFYDAWFENAADKCSIYFDNFVEWLCTKL